ncbi:hypothetical protein Nepgr_008891 [Nepenthes gracilis]|uniref:poly(A)-specific ribonuclease n=1 Tax=Nepenthes gracilis TaxID=150966 RepID=A0AAD3XJW7_NEPGR|nr:hypothetical protein Nepgr_008891 [Nepenthes gracilis]
MSTGESISEMVPKGRDMIRIIDVWDHNLEEVIALLGKIVDDYRYVAVNSRSPFIRPVVFTSTVDSDYQALKGDVNNSKLYQLGLTFFDERGNLPTDGIGNFMVWQFNFRLFDSTEDVYNFGDLESGIKLLKQSGIDFKKNYEMGIDLTRFGELLMSSGVVLNDEIRWVTLHSRYDLGCLLKVLTGRYLPDSLEEFVKKADAFFPVVDDIRLLMMRCGLNSYKELQLLLEAGMIDTCHEVGSRCLLARRAFMKLKDRFFSGSLEQCVGAALYDHFLLLIDDVEY